MEKILDVSKNKIGSLISPDGAEFEHPALEQLNLNSKPVVNFIIFLLLIVLFEFEFEFESCT